MAKLMDFSKGPEQSIEPAVAIESLAMLAKHVTNESMTLSDFSPNRLLKNIFPDLTNAFKSMLGLTDNVANGINLPPQYNKLQKALQTHTFGALAHLPVPVPEGFKGSFLAYSLTLGFAVDYAQDVGKRVSAFNVLLATILSSPEDQPLEMPSSIPLYNDYATKRKALQAQLSVYFQGKDNADTTAKYAEVIQAHKDWEPLLHSLDATIKASNSVNRKTLTKLVKETAELVDRFGERLKKQQLPALDSGRVVEITEGAYQLAQEVEFFVGIYYHVRGLQTSVDVISEKIRDFKLAPSTEGWFGGAKVAKPETKYEPEPDAEDLLYTVNQLLKDKPEPSKEDIKLTTAQSEHLGKVTDLLKGVKDFVAYLDVSDGVGSLEDISHEIRKGNHDLAYKGMQSYIRSSQALSKFVGANLLGGLGAVKVTVDSNTFYMHTQAEGTGYKDTFSPVPINHIKEIIKLITPLVQDSDGYLYGMDWKDMSKANDAVTGVESEEAEALANFTYEITNSDNHTNLLTAESSYGATPILKTILIICKKSLA